MRNSLRYCLASSLIAVAFAAATKSSAQNVWIGVSGVSATTNWSDTANWSLGLSPAFTDVLFGDLGAAAAAGTINSVVDTSGLDTSSLSFTNQSQLGFYHTILVPGGITLNNSSGFTVGVNSPINGYLTVVNFTGAGTLVQNGPDLTVKSIGSSSSTGARATLDLSGLSTFVYNGSLGTLTVAGHGGDARGGGTLILAAVSNNLTAATIDVNTGTGNGGAGGLMTLGPGTNIINVGNFNVAGGKTSSGTVAFDGAAGGLKIRGVGGTDFDRATFLVANRHNGGSGTPTGVLNFTGGHPVDILADTITLGQALSSNPGSSQGNTARFLFDAGKVDVTTVNMAVNALANVNTTGTLSVGGGILIAGAISLVNQTAGSGTGNLIITNGASVICSNDLVKTTSSGTGNITIDTGSLAVSGALGTLGAPIDTVSLSDATLTLAAGLTANANVTTLTCGGTTNKINITDVPAVSAYPAQIELIKYSGALGGTFNIGLGTLPSSSPAYVGYISNNAANSSIDLVLTSGKMPARSISWRGNINSDWDTTTANWFFGSSTTYNEDDFVLFDDTATATTVNLTAPRTPTSVTVSNATKPYTFTGFGNLSGNTGITKDGAAKLTIANSGLNDNTGPLIISAGTVQVGDGAGSGSLGPGDILNDGSIAFARDFLTVPNSIAGAGSLSQNSSGTLTLEGANSYDGPSTISQGTLVVGNNSALGSTNGGTTVASGATLDFNGHNIGLEPVTVSGSGIGNAGALVNNSTTEVYPAVAFVTLAGNTTIGGSTRWDLRSASTTNPNQSYLLTGGQPYKLTKVGGNQLGIVGSTVDPQLGDIDVQGGVLGFEGALTGLGNPANNLTVWPGAQVKFYNLTNELNKKFYLGSDSIAASMRNDSGENTVIGPITMTNDCSIIVDSGTTLHLNGPLGGAGLLNKNDNGTLVLGGAATHAGTMINVGKLILNGTHTGGITNVALTTFAGSGTNSGFTDLNGDLFPGDTNAPGTITLSGLNLEPGAQLFVDLANATTVGGGVNDLVQVNGDLTINGNVVMINPLGLLAGHTYTIIKYTGTLINNGGFFAIAPDNYNVTVDTTTTGQIKLVVTGGPPVWNGASITGSLWSDPANWGGTAINSGNSLYFGGSARLNNTNDTFPGSSYLDLAFVEGAGAFTLNGNALTLGGSILNSSANPQKVLLDVAYTGNPTFNGGTGSLIIGGSVTNNSNLSTLTLAGTGILTNLLANPDGFTNILSMTSTNANWTLMDNPSSLPLDIPMELDIQAGTFNFGSGSSAPVVNSTTRLNSRIGAVPSEPGIFNMVNGTLTIAVRLNLGGSADAISTLNQSGGTINIMDVLQGADNSAGNVAFLNISGGTLNVGESETSPNTLFLCSRGTGTLNVSAAGLARCGTLDMSRNASSAGTTGTVNLDGGTLDVQRVTCGTSATGSGGTPTATFYFNGGTLKARQSRTDFFVGRASAPAIPITSIVKSGGAVIDSAGFDITIAEPLQHDSALGGTADGGLTKNGDGSLTLTAANTYTGDTVVNGGTLLVNGSLDASSVTAATGTLGGNGTIAGGVVVNATGAISPGAGGIGALTVNNTINLQGTTVMDLGATTNDVLRGGASIAFGGTLNLVFAPGTVTSASTYKLFSAGSYSGSFTLDPATPAPGLGWDTSTLATDGTLRVVQTVNTTPTDITFSTVGGTLELSWPADHTGWRLEAQTNSINVGLSTTWTDVSGANSTNRVIITPDPANGTVFYRLVYP